MFFFLIFSIFFFLSIRDTWNIEKKINNDNTAKRI